MQNIINITKYLSLKSIGFKRGKIAVMELGKTYRITTLYTYFNKHTARTADCTLIRTGSKGFNFLIAKTNGLFLKRPIYQNKSAKRPISKNQTVFELVLPFYFANIEILDPNTITKYIDTTQEIIELNTQDTFNTIYKLEI